MFPMEKLLAMFWMLSMLLCVSAGGIIVKIRPKVFIIDMFASEAEAWYGIPQFNLLEKNITIPGLSPLPGYYSAIHCTKDGSICQVITGQAEINAASTISALIYSARFDLTFTYFLIAGIAGISPKLGTLGSVTFARYAVQVGLQHEIDAREKPANFPYGYFPQGTTSPGEFPTFIDGTEVFEVNVALRDLAVNFAKTAKLRDSPGAQAARANYSRSSSFGPGAAPPSVVACDTATSDTFWSGELLSEAFENTTLLFTNHHGIYCSTQQEDNATLNALMRGALSAVAGVPVVQGILAGWDHKFRAGVPAPNYIGDIFGSLGGKPDFVPGN
ncbi:purine nucleoside permease [Mycena floridula]|nr:purine nucleoside permease [Mycena floridula]